MKNTNININIKLLLILSVIFCFLNIAMVNANIFSIKIAIYAFTYFFMLYILLRVKKFNLLSIPMLFSIYHAVYIGLGPIFLSIHHFLFLNGNSWVGEILDNKNFFNQQCFLILLSYFLFLIINLIFGDSSINYDPIKLKNNSSKKSNIKDKRLKNNSMLEYSKIICFGMLLVSFILEIIYIFINKTLLFGGDLENGRIISMSGNGIYLYGIWLGTFAIAILFEMVMRGKFNFKFFIVLFIFHVLAISLLGFRSRIISLLIFMILIYNRYKKLNFKKIVIFGSSMILFVSFLGVIRDFMSGGINDSIIKTSVKLLGNGSVNLYYIFDFFPKKSNFLFGYTYLINIKMLAPGPGIDFTLWLKELLGLSFSGGGVTPTLLGEAFMNFGIIGVILTFIITGLITVYLDKKYYTSNNIYFISFFIWILTSSVRGGFSNSNINLLLFSIVNIILLTLFKKIKKGEVK